MPLPPVVSCPVTTEECRQLDSEASSTAFSANYRLNYGSLRGSGSGKEWDYNGMVSGHRAWGKLHPQDVKDGTSNTALYSERLVKVDLQDLLFRARDNHAAGQEFEVHAAQHPRRYRWHLQRRYHLNEEMDLLRDCRVAADHGTVWPVSAHRVNAILWTLGTGYYHLGVPNERSCVPKGSGRGMTTATSLHTGGVNVVMADGSLRFASENIDESVWMAVGARNGGEQHHEF